MGSLSASTHRGLVLWQGFLVAVSLFNFWYQPTTARLAIMSTYAAEGYEAVLRIRDMPPNVLHLWWYKGDGTDDNDIIAFLSNKEGRHLRGPPSGPLVLNKDGSLTITKVSKADAGMYTIVIRLTDLTKESGFGTLYVYEPELVVSLEASSTTVTENDTLVLTCNTNAPFIHWVFDYIHMKPNERMKISKDHRILTIDPVKRKDAGPYQCEGYNPLGYRDSWPVTVDVKFE